MNHTCGMCGQQSKVTNICVQHVQHHFRTVCRGMRDPNSKDTILKVANCEYEDCNALLYSNWAGVGYDHYQRKHPGWDRNDRKWKGKLKEINCSYDWLEISRACLHWLRYHLGHVSLSTGSFLIFDGLCLAGHLQGLFSWILVYHFGTCITFDVLSSFG